MDFGPALKFARQTANRTQRDVAAAIGISEPYLSDIERGRRGLLSAAQILALEPLGLDVDAILRAAVRSCAGEYIDALEARAGGRS